VVCECSEVASQQIHSELAETVDEPKTLDLLSEISSFCGKQCATGEGNGVRVIFIVSLLEDSADGSCGGICEQLERAVEVWNV
jgi:hypothetical protein